MRFVLDPFSPSGISQAPKQDFQPHFAGGAGKPSLVDSVAGKTGAITLSLSDMDDVVISGTPSDNQALAWDTATGKFIPQTISGGSGGSVESVNGQTGAVVLDADDIDDSTTDHKFATAQQLANADTAVQPEDLATVAATGDYNDLANTPSLFSGDYDDLDNKPSIPSTFDDLTDGTTNKAFTSALKDKLDGIEAGAEVNTVDSVNGQTGAVSLDADDVLPEQSGNSGKFLSTNGTTASWETVSGGGGGSMDDFTVAGDSGTPQTISDGNTLTIAGGTGIDTVAENTDKLTVALDSGTQSSLSKADSALQSGDNISELTNDAGYTSNAGTVTSVAVSGSDGIEVDSGSPITSNGTIALGINKTSLLSHLNVEDGADVTDATNVAAAGAVMESDTSTANMSFVIDEDDMASDSATKVPTQQSVKAYVDANSGGGGGSGDVTGPNESTANGIAVFDGDTGKLIKDTDGTGFDAFTIDSGVLSSTSTANKIVLSNISVTGDGISAEGFKTNLVNEWSSGSGVTIDGVLIKDGLVDGKDVSSLTANTGDVAGPGSSTDNAIARFDGTTGKLLQDSSKTTITDDGDIIINKSGSNTAQYSYNGVIAGSGYEIKAVEDLTLDGGSASSSLAVIIARDNLATNAIRERTAGSGVTIDGVLLKDGTVDGRDVSADGSKLDGIEAGADVTDATNVAAAGAFMKAADDLDDITAGSTNKHFTSTEKTKLANVTYYVPIDPVQVLNTDPGDTDWHDLDVSAQISSDAVAVHCSAYITASGAGRNLSVRKNGSSATFNAETIVLRAPGGESAAGTFNVGVDSNGVFEWAVANADVSQLRINVLGYWTR